MTKAEKNYKRDYGHKDSEELALNYTRDGMREELDKALSEVSPDDLSEGEKEYLDGRHQCRDHTLNIRFNDTEWERICRQAEALHVKKSSYVRECTKAHFVMMFDKDEMNELMKQIRGIAANINQVAYRANSTGNIYGNDIADLKARLDDIWQSLQIHPVRRTVSAAIRYIIDGDKTGDHSLVQSFMCEGKSDRAAEQFREVRQRVGTGRSATLAQHLIQSFLPGEVTPEQAMMIGEELCHRLLGEQYQFVIATHIDHSHIHNHIVFNNTNMISGYTFETEHNQGKKSERAWAEIQKLSDDICRENGLSVIEHPKSKGVSHYEYEARKSGISWKEHLRQILKAIIVQSTSLDDFFIRCTEHNIEYVYKPENKVKLKYRPQGKERFVRADTLGEEYTPEAITESIMRMQNALAVAQRFTMHKADEASAITAEPKSANTAVITTDDFIVSGAENSITDPETDAPEKEEKADGWASIRGMRICDDIIADMESVGIHSLAEYNALSVTGWTKREELGKKLGKLKSQILAIDELIAKINHLKELSDTYKEYKGLTGFKQSRFRKKNAAAIDDYEQTNSYIWEHIEPYKQDDKAPTVKQLTDRSNDMKLRFNAMAQEYNHLLEVEAVMGKQCQQLKRNWHLPRKKIK